MSLSHCKYVASVVLKINVRSLDKMMTTNVSLKSKSLQRKDKQLSYAIDLSDHGYNKIVNFKIHAGSCEGNSVSTTVIGTCLTPPPPPPDTPGSIPVTVIAAAVASFLLVILVLIGVILYRRKRNHNPKSKKRNSNADAIIEIRDRENEHRGSHHAYEEIDYNQPRPSGEYLDPIPPVHYQNIRSMNGKSIEEGKPGPSDEYPTINPQVHYQNVHSSNANPTDEDYVAYDA